jgi:predicted ATPase/DNA-binding CsgD family transcriptional regulator
MNSHSCGLENTSESPFRNQIATEGVSPPEQGSAPEQFQNNSGSFVGRQREMCGLRTALDEALSGQGRLVMLVGEPGIGKTQTAKELSSYAAQHGTEVLWGRCYEEPGMPPYWPWVQIIRAYLRGWGGGHLRFRMGAGAANIAEMVPEVRELLPDLPSLPALEPHQARFRLFDSIAAFLMRASEGQPLMLVLDNLHWADRSSLLLLEFLAQELADCRLLVVGTCRDDELTGRHLLSSTMGELVRFPCFSRISLGGLSQAEVGSFIQAKARIAPAPDLIEAVHTQTEGNPLFVSQVVELLAQEGQLASERASPHQAWEIQIPPGVQEVIRRRLEHLSENCNQVLAVASVVGREFGLGLLERLMADPATPLPRGSGHGLSSDDVLEGVEEALTSRVIEEMPHSVDRYQFTHVLIQNTLAREFSAARRARLHASIGQALEEMYNINTEVHAAELAYHFAETGSVLSAEKVVRYSLLAGERALATFGYEEALAHFQRGLAARGISVTGTEPAPDAQAAALLFGLGKAQFATYERLQIADADASLGRAFEYYFQSESIAETAAVAEFFYSAISSQNRRQRISRALTIVPKDSIEAGRLLACYIAVLGDSPTEFQVIQELSERALAVARREADQILEMRILVAAGHACAHQLQHLEVLERDLPAIDLAQSIGEPLEEVHAQYEVASALYAIGDLQGADRHAAAALDVAEKASNKFWQARALALKGAVSGAQGNWQEARNFSDRSLAIFPRDPDLLGSRAVLEYQVGQLSPGKIYLETLLEVMDQSSTVYPHYVVAVTPLALPIVARITGTVQDFEVARAYAETVLASSTSPPMATHRGHLGLALMAVEQNDAQAARRHFTHLEPLRGTMPLLQASYIPGPALDRVLGLLCRTMGNLDRAISHFEDALTICKKGYQTELAWTCHDFAETLLQRNLPGDQFKAMSLLEESLAVSSELGMWPLTERVTALQGLALLQATKAPAYPDSLTQREVEVLQLIAAGKTDREIAEALVIAASTVRRHVNNIYAKIGVNNRAEATRYTLREGLIPMDP